MRVDYLVWHIVKLPQALMLHLSQKLDHPTRIRNVQEPTVPAQKVFRPKSLISIWLTCGMTTSMGDSAVWILVKRMNFSY